MLSSRSGIGLQISPCVCWSAPVNPTQGSSHSWHTNSLMDGCQQRRRTVESCHQHAPHGAHRTHCRTANESWQSRICPSNLVSLPGVHTGRATCMTEMVQHRAQPQPGQSSDVPSYEAIQACYAPPRSGRTRCLQLRNLASCARHTSSMVSKAAPIYGPERHTVQPVYEPSALTPMNVQGTHD